MALLNSNWDIPKIIKLKATTSLRVSCLFCIFKHSPQKNGLTVKTGIINNKNTW
ncbi:hypothetical protein QR305_02768 [Bacteroides finegoldii]|uniref:Uncharacterized protein n=1 Tax=Bacteroides finegoldii CL09T03C10 TaxID=997888 RepID=K5CFZ4_9BACE|nr:hypothetical protein HMPREF1057_01344 [Bacteroides finegoldii CL09T03C10]